MSGTRSAPWASLLAVAVLLGPALVTALPAAQAGARWMGGFHPDLLVRAQVHPAGQRCTTTALCPSTVRTAYNFTGLLSNGSTNGTGQTIVIVDACGDRHIATDLVTFDTTNKLPVANLTVTHVGGGTVCANAGWGLETALDVEWAHAMAPGANLHLIVVSKPNDSAMYSAWNYSLANHLGNVISNSWGGDGACKQWLQSIVAAASAAHVTLLASAGDGGAWGLGSRLTSQNPADCKAVTTVGGTSLNVNAAGGYSSESAWGGSGGGYYGGLTEPSYQLKVNIPDTYGKLGKPDVSAVADPATGVWMYDHDAGGWFTVGGTSVACPMWAGLVADTDSLRAANGFHALGAMDQFLYLHVYGVNGTGSSYASAFHDVTSGSNGWSAGTGWDAATGIGSFNGYPLVQLLGAASAA